MALLFELILGAALFYCFIIGFMFYLFLWFIMLGALVVSLFLIHIIVALL